MKTRMNASHREAITFHVHAVVDDAEAKAARDVAMVAITEQVQAHLLARFPQADMAILERYEHAECRDAVSLDAGRHTAGLPIKIRPLLTPKCTFHGRVHVADMEAAFPTIEAQRVEAHKLYNAWSNSRDQKWAAYRRTFDAVRYVEDAIDLWPDLARIIGGSARPSYQLVPVADREFVLGDIAARAGAASEGAP